MPTDGGVFTRDTSKEIKTMLIFSLPSFLKGMAQALDIGGTLKIYRKAKDESSADYVALLNDWEQVGTDLNWALEAYEYGE